MFVMAWGDDLLSYSDSRQGGQALVVTPCWFHLLTLFGAGAKMGSRWYGQACSAVTLQVGQSIWVERLPVLLGEGDAYRHLQLWNIVLDPRELPRFPHHLLYTLSCLLCRSCSLSPQLFLKRNSCMYRWIFQCAHGRRRVHWPPVPHHFRPLPFSISCLTLLKFLFDLSCLPFQFYLLPPFVPFPHYLQFARYAVLYFASVKF